MQPILHFDNKTGSNDSKTYARHKLSKLQRQKLG